MVSVSNNMSQTVNVRFKAVGILLGVLVAVLVLYQLLGFTYSTASRGMGSSSSSWMVSESKFVDIPEEAIEASKSVEVKMYRDRLLDFGGQKKMTFYRTADVSADSQKESQSEKPDILLLHGMAFKSLTWEELGTIQLFASLGYKVVAVDLPGYGECKGSDHELGEIATPAVYMDTLIKALDLKAPVIISPSMSGSYSLPYLVEDPENVRSRCQGYVPVAPVATGTYVDKFTDLKVPTLIFCGELDKGIGPEANANLQKLPMNKLIWLKDARHPAYLDQPAYFHKALYNFLLTVQKMNRAE